MWTSALFDAKNFGFFKIYGMSARKREEGGSASADFFGQGGPIFFDFMRTSFVDGPLWKTKPYVHFSKSKIPGFPSTTVARVSFG